MNESEDRQQDKKITSSNIGEVNEENKDAKEEMEEDTRNTDNEVDNDDNDTTNLMEPSYDHEERIMRKAKSNTGVSTYSPAYISEPIYEWEVSKNDRIFYDKINDFIIHQNSSTKALLVTDIKKNEENYNGVYVKFDKEFCEHICFSLNGSFFLYYSKNPNKIEISDILNNHNIYLNVEISKLNECELLAVFWLNEVDSQDSSKIKKNNLTYSDFVVVTNFAIEIFRLTFDSLTITSLKKHCVQNKFCWYDENSLYIVLLSNKNNILLPYMIKGNAAIKLPQIELNLVKHGEIEKEDIQVVNLYNDTYCIHKDHKNGRISFRCLSSNTSYDYVLDLFCSGNMEVFTVDNLLVVFNHSNEKVYLSDIQHNRSNYTGFSSNAMTNINNNTINILYLTAPKPFNTSIQFSNILFKSSSVLIDTHLGNFYKIKIDYDVLMLQICQHFSNLNTSVDILLRRPNCRSRITEMIFLSLENEIKIEDYLNIINIINMNYRKLIEEVAKKRVSPVSKKGKKITQSLEHLLKNAKDTTLITEKDLVIHVFHPFIMKKYNMKKRETLFNFAINFREMEKNKELNKKKNTEHHINIHENVNVENNTIHGKTSEYYMNVNCVGSDTSLITMHGTKEGNCFPNVPTDSLDSKDSSSIQNGSSLDENIDSNYNIAINCLDFENVRNFLSYVLEYMKSLLYLNIIPNRILQTFIFDLCIFFKRDNCLRQLLQFYVISDSVEITKRLFHFWKLTKYKWAFQFCLDMSLRLKEYELVIHLFLCSKEYVRVLEFIRKHNLFDYPICVLFQAIENDMDLPNKYIIMNYLIQSLDKWIEDSEKDPIKYPLPNLQNCEKWIQLVEEL